MWYKTVSPAIFKNLIALALSCHFVITQRESLGRREEPEEYTEHGLFLQFMSCHSVVSNSTLGNSCQLKNASSQTSRSVLFDGTCLR